MLRRVLRLARMLCALMYRQNSDLANLGNAQMQSEQICQITVLTVHKCTKHPKKLGFHPGPKNTPKIFSGCLVENNIVYWGNDIVNNFVETHQACADLCASTPGGLFWTFTEDKLCYVKSSSSGKKTKQDRISGNRECKLICKKDLICWDVLPASYDTLVSSDRSWSSC